MEKEKSNLASNYVCEKCWYQLDDCVCEKPFFPPKTLIHIDVNIQSIIRVLNNKGYDTNYCCEGHYTDTFKQMYVSFCNRNNFSRVGLPSGFYYDRRFFAIRYDYSSLTESDFDKEKASMLARFLEWCNNLPLEDELNG